MAYPVFIPPAKGISHHAIWQGASPYQVEFELIELTLQISKGRKFALSLNAKVSCGETAIVHRKQ